MAKSQRPFIMDKLSSSVCVPTSTPRLGEGEKPSKQRNTLFHSIQNPLTKLSPISYKDGMIWPLVS